MARNLEDAVGRIKGNFEGRPVDDGEMEDNINAADLEEGVAHNLGDGSDELLLLAKEA